MDHDLYRESLLERLAEVEAAVDDSAALRAIDYVLLVCIGGLLPVLLMLIGWLA